MKRELYSHCTNVMLIVPKLMDDSSKTDDAAHYIVKSIYSAMSKHVEQVAVQVSCLINMFTTFKYKS